LDHRRATQAPRRGARDRARARRSRRTASWRRRRRRGLGAGGAGHARDGPGAGGTSSDPRAAADGRLSDEQLTSFAQIADGSTDEEWAERAPHVPAVDLRRMVRARSTLTVEESWRRRDARCLWMRWNEARSILRFGGELPDLMGAEFETTVTELVDKLK